MAQYCGCKTVQNRVKWGAFAVLFLLAVLFTILWITSSTSAAKNFSDCELSSDYDEYTKKYTFDDQKCLDDYISAWGAIYAYMTLSIVCFIACTIPLYVMCCCTQPPSNNHTLSSLYELQAQQTAYTAVPVNQQTPALVTNNNKFDII